MSTREIFVSYSHKDEALREELEKQLSLLKWQGLITAWHDRRIGAGHEWESEIDERLNSAQIILLLVSPDFMASNYCYGIEVKRAMKRHKAGQALVIPIILRPADWQSAPFGKLQALPKDGQPVTGWLNRDEAFLDIARGIRKTIEELNKSAFITSESTRRKSPSQHSIKHPNIAQCPYRGLFAFQEEDEPYFFGREIFTQQLVNVIHQKPFVAVIGSSGSGKSSVVFAGLIPHLRREGSWLITSLRPGDRPFRSLSLALMPLLEPQKNERERLLESNKLGQQLQQNRLTLRDIVELIAQKQSGRRFLLVIDQFEELYTLFRDPEIRDRFLDQLVSIVQAASEYDFLNFSLLLTLRADFLGQALDHHRPFADALQSSNLLLPPMNVQELQDTIRKPAQALNVTIEEGLTEHILQEVRSASNRLPLLEFALTLLWNKQKRGRLTHTGYIEIGGVEKALTDHAEYVFADLSEVEKMQAQQVFMQLVHFGEGTEDTRRLATRSEIGEENWKLVMHLSSARARLVVTGRDQISGEETVEVVHEALIRGWQHIQEWIANNREFRIWQDRLRDALRQWEKNNRDDGALLHGASLVEADKWMAQRSKDISKQEKAFIDLSQQYHEKEAQRWKTLYEESQRFALLYQSEQELGKITELLELEQAYDVILRIAEKYSQSQVVIRRYDEFDEKLFLVRATGYQDSTPATIIRVDEGINGQVAREKHSIIIENISNPPPDVVSINLSDPSFHSIVIVPIMFKERYYGNLGISHKDVAQFQDTDINFYEGLAQQLASTIYRLELVQARLELEKRALSEEEMSSIGQVAFEITHRLGNDLGLIDSYIYDIYSEMETQSISNKYISKKLDSISQSVRGVLNFSGELKRELAKTGVSEAMGSEAVVVSPKVVLEEILVNTSPPSNISISMMIDEYVADVRIVPKLVADILHNLIVNAIEAMPEGGKITLRARNTGQSVALEVHDTGIGISPNNLSRIFDLFFSTKGSTGFGLWSARRNALRNHGDIKVTSQLGQGTTFTFLLPKY